MLNRWVLRHKTKHRYWNGEELTERWLAKEYMEHEKGEINLPPPEIMKDLKWVRARIRSTSPTGTTKPLKRKRSRHYARLHY